MADNEELYFRSYQKHKKAGLNDVAARVMAEKESGTTPKKSWVAKLKGGVKKEMAKSKNPPGNGGQMDVLRRNLTQEQIDRLKGK